MSSPADIAPGARVGSVALAQWAADVFAACGVPPAPARTAAHCLVRTSLRGIDTHGISRLAAYADKLQSAEVNATAEPQFETVHGMLRCDGRSGLGQVVVTQAVERAVALARTQAIVACSLHASGHLAALGILALPAAEQGMVALLCQRTPPVMALPGSHGRAIGNNPLAFAMPVAGGAPLVFDMAQSVVARGHLMQAAREGRESVPSEWAIGPDGHPTNDVARALAGAMQPIAGHKGIGLAMMVECLAGSLAGVAAAPVPAEAGAGGSASNVSAFLLVIHPALAIGQAAFAANTQAWLDTYLRSSGPAARYPGQRQAACEQERLATGIPLPAGLLAELRQLGLRMALPFVA